MKRLISAAWALFFITACSQDTGSLSVHRVRPSATDPAITAPDTEHLAGYDTAAVPLGRLVLFLGGTASDPSGYQRFLKAAAGLGYHVISLSYPNASSVGALARNNLAEYGQVRSEICWGLDSSTLISVNAADSITNRARKLLINLSGRFPAERWGQFLDAQNGPAWDKIVLAGYSQGAGHAAYIAKHISVTRVVLFSGVVDGRVESPWQSADWVADTNWQTPVSAFRLFESTKDGYYPAIKANLLTLSLDPDNASQTARVDSETAPYGGKKLLLTDYPDSGNGHAVTVEDGATPLLPDGAPRFAPVWKAMLE